MNALQKKQKKNTKDKRSILHFQKHTYQFAYDCRCQERKALARAKRRLISSLFVAQIFISCLINR